MDEGIKKSLKSSLRNKSIILIKQMKNQKLI